VLHWAHEDLSTAVPEIGIGLSLTVIVLVLAITTVASLLKTRKDPDTKAHAGSVRAPSVRAEDRRQPR
jgi:tellurite resistance protein TerC